MSEPVADLARRSPDALDARIDELAEELALDLKTSLPIRSIAKHYAQIEDERDRLLAALRVISRYAEEQELLIPLHEQRQINEALGHV